MHVTHKGNRLHLKDDDGFAHTYSALWLREASASPDWRDPKTGHKLGDGNLLPPGIVITGTVEDSESVDLTFSDEHHARFSLAALRQAAEHPHTTELDGERQPWDAALSPLPWHQLADLQDDPHEILSALTDLARLGFTLIRGIPAEPGGMRQFTDLIGFIRITNNGAIEDIRAVPPEHAYDLSMTPRALEPHTDNPYRIPQPGYVLLHCLANDADGGQSGMTDGFHAADRIRRGHPDLFEALCTVPVTWRYTDEQAILEDTSPFIDLALDGSVKHVRFHGRADHVAAIDAGTLDTFFQARRVFSSLVSSDDLQLRFKLRPGEMFMIDNYRLIHSRRAFKLQAGSRHMRQAYIDRDVVSSRQKTLLKDITATPWKHRA
jgi:gamma-butyrobetaine dioxygenase